MSAERLERQSVGVRRRVLAQSGVQVAGKAVNFLGGFAVLWLLTRFLGRAGFGEYTLVTGYVGLFYIVTDMGSQSIAVREMAQDRDRAGLIAGQLLMLKVTLALIAYGGALIIVRIAPVASFGSMDIRTGVAVAGLALLAVPLSATAGAVCQTALRMTIPTLSDVASRLVTLVIIAGVVLAAGGLHPNGAVGTGRLDTALMAVAIGSWAGAILAAVGAARLVRIRPIADLSVAWGMIRDAAPLALVLILGLIHYRVDIFILSAMRGNADVGIYGVATKVLDAALVLGAIFMGLAFPILSERVRGDSALLQRALRKAFDFMLIAGLAGALLTSALAPYIVRFLAPASFGPASVPMAIIAWAIPVTFANMVLAHLLVAGNYQFQALPVSVAAIVLNAALNVVLIPALGPSAPALVTVISETAGALGIGALVIRRYGFGPSATAIIKIAVVTAATALTLFGLQRISPIGAVAVGAVVFGGGLWQLRVIDRHDLALLLARPAVG